MEEQTLIAWRSKALLQVENIVSFLNEQGQFQAADDFLENVKIAAHRVALSPKLGRLEKHDGEVRSWLIDRNRKLIYKMDAGRLVVLQVWDTRQDPGKLKI